MIAQFIVTFMFVIGCTVKGVDNAREVEGGVEILKVGPIQLIIPDVLAFTVKNSARCNGFFRICYVSEPTKSRDELRQKYFNVGWNCPPKTCTLSIEPEKGVFGLANEMHDGNFYGMFVDGSRSWCPRHIVDGRMNFTVIDMPDCPVIIDGALLPKDDVPEPKRDSFMKWVITAICIGIAVVLLLIVVAIALYCCIRSKKKPGSPANSEKRNQRSQKMSTLPAVSPKKFSLKTPAESNTAVSRSPTSNKGQNSSSNLRKQQCSAKPSIQQIDCSDSVTNNDDM
uniref:Uncharacterized protein n=1 Tax=Panagrellus redivivus TaxID=6233 RepID=A0A7E4W462_PANRE